MQDFNIDVLMLLVTHSPMLVLVLMALAPVLSVCVAGYAVHIVGKLHGRRPR